MRPHHEKAIQKLVEHFETDESCLAVIIGGSIAKGLEREDSDVDAILVVTDELYKEKLAQNQPFYVTAEFCDYPGGYIDAKIVDMDYLKAVAERGNEVARGAFTGAFVAHSKVPGLEEIVRRIPVYQPGEKREKIQSFYAQFEYAYWVVGEAKKRNDRYLLHHTVADLVLYGGRLILAHNEILFPYHKFLLTELARAPEKPDNLMALIDALLEEHTPENAKAFYDAIKDFHFWNEAWEAWPVRFLKDTETAWLTRKPFVGDA